MEIVATGQWQPMAEGQEATKCERPAPLGPLYVEANRYEDAARGPIDHIREFTPRTLAGVIVQLELAVEREDIDTAASALRGLHEIAKREASR